VPALERRLQGCYRLVAWRESGDLRFRPPTLIRLDTLVLEHDGYWRVLRLAPSAAGGEARWHATLPDTVSLDWLEAHRNGSGGYGGIGLTLTRRWSGALRGRAIRYKDWSSGQDPYAEVRYERDAKCAKS
jgi:hypothetical protein